MIPGILPALFLLFALASDALAQFDAFDDGSEWPPVVEVIPPEGDVAVGGRLEVRFRVSAQPGIHIYRDEIAVALDDEEGVSLRKLVLPEGRSVPDALNPGRNIEVLEGEFEIRAFIDLAARVGGAVTLKGTLSLRGCTDEICHPPHDEPFELTVTVAKGAAGEAAEPAALEAGEGRAASVGEILLLILGAFGAGVLLSLTPCVFPMIPVTSAIIMSFSKGGGKVAAFFSSCLYVLGVAVTYSVIGVIVAFAGGAIQSTLNSSPVRWTIAGIYLALGVSMFGLFDLAMPSAFASKLQQQSSGVKRNYFGLVGMGMISGLIVGPCVTAPIVGLLIKIAEINSIVIGFAAMFALSWGMGLLIITAGTFTGLIPKAGPWMEWFKKLFGFLLLGGALYTAKSMISETAFNYSGSVLLVFAAVFLGGLDSLSSDAGVGLRLKKVVGVLCLIGALALLLPSFQGGAGGGGASSSVAVDKVFQPGGSAEFAAAEKGDKPVLLYFTADWCTNCKVLKKDIFSKPRAQEALEGVSAIMVDFDESKDLVRRFSIKGPPTLLFFGRDGRERTDLRAHNFDSVEDFVEHLRKLL